MKIISIFREEIEKSVPRVSFDHYKYEIENRKIRLIC